MSKRLRWKKKSLLNNMPKNKQKKYSNKKMMKMKQN